jgi:DHA2 family multidrug resistance protein
VSFAAFVIWELTAEHPIVNLRVFRHRGFAVAILVMAFTFGGFFATNLLTPLWLQTNLGYTSQQAGLAASATGILAIAAGPVAAMLSTRMDERLLVTAGVGWLTLTTLLRGLANTDMTFWHVWGVLVLVGASMPTFFIPLMTIALGAVDVEETADASGMTSFVRTLSGAFATSVVTTLWENDAAAHHGDLVGRVNDLPGAMGRLQAAGLDSGQALSVINRLVDQQAVLLATNQLFWGIAAVLALGLVLVWAIPRPRRPVEGGIGH